MSVEKGGDEKKEEAGSQNTQPLRVEGVAVWQGSDTGNFISTDEQITKAMNQFVTGLINKNWIPDYWLPNLTAKWTLDDLVKEKLVEIHENDDEHGRGPHAFLSPQFVEQLLQVYREAEEQKKAAIEKKKQERIEKMKKATECDAPLNVNLPMLKAELNKVKVWRVYVEGDELVSDYEFYQSHKDLIKPFARWIPDRKVWKFRDMNALQKVKNIIDEQMQKREQLQKAYNDAYQALLARAYKESFAVDVSDNWGPMRSYRRSRIDEEEENDVMVHEVLYFKFKEDAQNFGTSSLDEESGLWKVSLDYGTY